MLNVTSPHAYLLVICDNTVDETVCFGLFCTHVVITLGIHLDDAKRLAGIGCQMLIQFSSGIQKYGRIMYLSSSSSGGKTSTKAVISVVDERSSPP